MTTTLRACGEKLVTGLYVSAFVPIVTVSVSALFFRAHWRLRSLKQELLTAL
jgi:hypothetical protein